MTHYVVLGELWRSGRRAQLVPSADAFGDRVGRILGDYWEERHDGLDERAADLTAELRTAITARAEDAHAELMAMHDLVVTVRGLLTLEAGDRARATDLLTAALAADRERADPALRALALLHTGRLEEAERALDELGELDEAHEFYVRALLTKERDPAAALGVLDEACARWTGDLRLARFRHELAGELDRLTPEVWGGLGRALFDAGRYEAAADALGHADQDDVDTLLWLTDACSAIGDHARAAANATAAATRLQNPHLHIIAADQYSRVGDMDDEATAQVDEALKDADHVIRFGAAQILLSTGDAARARDLVRQVREIMPDDPRLMAVEGVALFGTMELEESEELLSAAFARLPDEPVVLRHLGVVLFNLDRLEEARPLLDQALELDPGDSWILAVRGDLRRRLYDLPGAKADLDAAADRGFETAWTLRAQAQVAAHEDPDEALRLLDQALEIDPDLSATHAARGEVLYAKGLYNEAGAAFSTAQGLYPYDPVALTALTGFWLSGWNDAEVEDAREVVAESIRRHPDYLPLRSAFCDILDRLDRQEEGDAEAERIVALHPRDGEDYRLYGLALSRLGRRTEAVDAFRRGIDLAPGHAGLHANLGVELNLLGERESAEKSLLAAVERDPEFPFALARLGNLLLAGGRFDEAEPYLRKAVDLWPDEPDPLLDLSEVLRMTGRPLEALPLVEQALVLQESAFALGSRGQLRYAVGRLEEAREDLQRAVEMDPDLAWARGTLAEVLRMMGRLDEAIHHAGLALPGTPESQWLLAVRGTAYFAKGDYEAAERDLRAAGPSDMLALSTLRDLLVRQGRTEEAVELLREQAMLGPSLRTDGDPQVAVLFGEALQSAGRHAEARDTLELAASIWPEEAQFQAALAWLELAMGRNTAAVRAAEEAVRLAPGNPERLFVLGSIQRFTKRPIAAIGTLTEAVRLDPEAAWIWAELSVALAYVAAWGPAIEAGEQAVAEGRMRTSYCFEMFAWAQRYREEPDLGAALAAYDAALGLDSGSVGAFSGKADTLYALGEGAAAAALYEKVVEMLSPHDTDQLATRAWCLYRLGRFAESLDFYQRYQAVRPERPGFLLFDLGLLAWAEGDDEAARSSYAQALEDAALEAPERTRGLIEVAVRDLEQDLRGNGETRAELLETMRSRLEGLPRYEHTTPAPDPSTAE